MLPYRNPLRKGWQSGFTCCRQLGWNQREPYRLHGLESYQNKKYKVLSTMYAEIYPIENLTIRTQFGADFTHSTAFLQSFPSLSSNGRVLRHARATMPST